MLRQPVESLAAGRSKDSPCRYTIPSSTIPHANSSTDRCGSVDIVTADVSKFGCGSTGSVGDPLRLREADLDRGCGTWFVPPRTAHSQKNASAEALFQGRREFTMPSRARARRSRTWSGTSRSPADHPYNPRNRSATGNGPKHVVGQTSPGLRTVQLHNSPSSRWWWSTIRSSGCTIR